MAESKHGEVITYFLTPEELEAYKQKTANVTKIKRGPQRKKDWEWPKSRTSGKKKPL